MTSFGHMFILYSGASWLEIFDGQVIVDFNYPQE